MTDRDPITLLISNSTVGDDTWIRKVFGLDQDEDDFEFINIGQENDDLMIEYANESLRAWIKFNPEVK